MSRRKSNRIKRKLNGSNISPMNVSYLWDYASLNQRRKIAKQIKRKTENSRNTFEKYILISSNLVEAMLNDDDISFQQGINNLNEISLLSDAPGQCFMELGFLMLIRNMASLALKPLEKAIVMMPDEREPWSLKSHAHLRLGQKEEAILCMESAVELAGYPEDIETLKELKNNAFEENKLLLAAFLHPGMGMDLSEPDLNSVDPIRMQIYMVKQIEKLDSNDPVVNNSLGQLYYRLNELEVAQKYIKIALTLGVNDASLLTCLGLIAKKTDRIDDMAMYYSQAIDLDPKEILARINLASFFHDSGEWNKARFLLVEAISLIENCKDGEIQEDFPCLAYDLFASNTAMTELDLRKELQIRDDIIKSGIFQTEASKANYAICLFFNGKFTRFLNYLDKLKGLKSLPNIQKELFRVYKKVARTGNNKPYVLFEFINSMVELDWPLEHLAFLIKKAISLTSKVSKEQQPDFLYRLGVLSAHMNDKYLENEIFGKAYKLNPNDTQNQINFAVSCSQLPEQEKKDKAYSLINKCKLEDGSRLYTMKANVCRNLSKHEEAIQNYKHAIEHDMEFDLPITNGMEISLEVRDWDSAEFFSNVVQGKQHPSNELKESYGAYLWERGFRRSALGQYSEILSTEGVFINELIDTTDDLSIYGKIDLSRLYWQYGCLLLEVKDFSTLDKLFEFLTIENSIDLYNGDHRVLHAESLRLRGESQEALEKLDAERIQIPYVLSQAFVFLDKKDFDRVDILLKEIEQKCPNQEPDNYNFWLGNCAPVLKTLQSKVLYHFDKKNEALQLVKKATSLAGATSYSDWEYFFQLQESSPLDECINEANDLLKLRPNNIQLISWLMETYIANNDIEKAKKLFSNVRIVLEQSGRGIEASNFGEQIALKELVLPNSIESIIMRGESLQVEFKSTLRTNLHTKNKDSKMEHAVLKTIAAFLNSYDGGTLFIGVDDNKKPIGIDVDGFPNEDKMELFLISKVKSSLGGTGVMVNIKPRFEGFQNKRVLVVDVNPHDSPVYLVTNQKEEFYIRVSASTESVGYREGFSYIRKRWPNFDV